MENEFKDIEGPHLDLLKRTTKHGPKGLPKIHAPTGRIVPNNYIKFAEKVRDMTVYEDDVWVITYPKSGTTWSQELTWLVNNNVDFKEAKDKLLELRFPYVEMSSHVDFSEAIQTNEQLQKTLSIPGIDEYLTDAVNYIENLSRPRHIKCHLHYGMLPTQLFQKKPKIIYVCRNPKDACISYFHHCRIFEGFEGTMEEFVELFLADLIICGPYWSHLKEFWNRRDEPNILFITYEDMKKDLESIVKKVAEFLGKPVPSEKMAELLKHLSFEEMKKNSAVNFELIQAVANNIYDKSDPNACFMRKGKVGSWKEELSPELIKRFDAWIEKNSNDTGITFYL